MVHESAVNSEGGGCRVAHQCRKGHLYGTDAPPYISTALRASSPLKCDMLLLHVLAWLAVLAVDAGCRTHRTDFFRSSLQCTERNN